MRKDILSLNIKVDDFYIAVEDEARFIMIWNPWWASISVDNPALPYLKEIVNLVNVDSLVTTVFTADEDEKKRGASFQVPYGLYSQRRPVGRISESYARSFLCYSRCYQSKICSNWVVPLRKGVIRNGTKVKGFACL